MDASFLNRPGLPDLAYVKKAAIGAKARPSPTVMFCSGYRSSMEGTKALYLENHCAGKGLGFVRFDYSGHGLSGGNFEDGTIGQWIDDALSILDRLTNGPVVIVGSSMGAWIALRLALARPDRIVGVVSIAGAPDFTRDILAKLTTAQKTALDRDGRLEQDSVYSDMPLVVMRVLLEEGERHCLLDSPIDLKVPLRLIQGMRDPDVPWVTPTRIRAVLTRPELAEIILIESGDHRLSRPEDLALIAEQLEIILNYCRKTVSG